MIELVIRLVFSLAVVVGMLLLLARFSAKRFRGGSGALVKVVHRQPLSRTSSVAVVTVGSRVLVLGTTEQQVQLLTELDPEELDLELTEVPPLAHDDLQDDLGDDLEDADPRLDELVPPLEPARRRTSLAARSASTEPWSESALAGSVLSAQTWKQALAAATGRERAAS